MRQIFHLGHLYLRTMPLPGHFLLLLSAFPLGSHIYGIYTEYGVRSSWLALSLKLSNVAPGSSLDGWPPGDCQVLYTLVGLREPRKSDGSSDWPRVGRKRISMDVGAVSIQRDPRKFTMCEYLAHKANLLGMKIAWCASMAAQLYISQETELEFEW